MTTALCAPAPHHDDEQLVSGRRGHDALTQSDSPGVIDARPFMRTRVAGRKRLDRANAGGSRRRRTTLIRVSEYAPPVRRDDGLGLDDERLLTGELLLDPRTATSTIRIGWDACRDRAARWLSSRVAERLEADSAGDVGLAPETRSRCPPQAQSRPRMGPTRPVRTREPEKRPTDPRYRRAMRPPRGGGPRCTFNVADCCIFASASLCSLM